MTLINFFKKINPFKHWKVQKFKQNGKTGIVRFLMKEYGFNWLIPTFNDFAHDHPQAFWTWPLWGYSELVLNKDGIWEIEYNKPWTWHYKDYGHAHIILGAGKPERYNINDPFEENFSAPSVITFCKRLIDKTTSYGAWVHKSDLERRMPIQDQI